MAPGIPFLIMTFAVAGLMSSAAAAPDSVCYGTSSHGRLQGGVQLPERCKNFVAYSPLGTEMGRTWVHAAVARAMLASWQQLDTAAPGVIYVYGETGH